jgi:hypothetical protein
MNAAAQSHRIGQGRRELLGSRAAPAQQQGRIRAVTDAVPGTNGKVWG